MKERGERDVGAADDLTNHAVDLYLPDAQLDAQGSPSFCQQLVAGREESARDRRFMNSPQACNLRHGQSIDVVKAQIEALLA
jgi:hypothetical protein